MKMNLDDQRYSMGNSPNAVNIPGVDSNGKNQTGILIWANTFILNSFGFRYVFAVLKSLYFDYFRYSTTFLGSGDVNN